MKRLLRLWFTPISERAQKAFEWTEKQRGTSNIWMVGKTDEGWGMQFSTEYNGARYTRTAGPLTDRQFVKACKKAGYQEK